jgi:hypothetical protein
MGKRDDALALLQQGFTPPQIAARQGVTLSTILGYLDQLVGRGSLRRSDIYFTMPAQVREALTWFRKVWKEEAPDAESWEVVQAARQLGFELPQQDLEVVWHYGDPHNFLGDMYEDLAWIELQIHRQIRDLLQASHGGTWWETAVPTKVREECEIHWKRARHPGDSAYLYTGFPHLHDIIKDQWHYLQNLFTAEYATSRDTVLTDLQRLNAIRNKVMHPVRGEIPTEEEFLFVRRVRKGLAGG